MIDDAFKLTVDVLYPPIKDIKRVQETDTTISTISKPTVF
jgi:hypothetical protein